MQEPTKVLGQDVLGRVGDPIVDVEGVADGFKIAVVEGEEVLVLIC